MPPKKKVSPPGWILLFLLPFLGIGATILWISGSQWWLFMRAQDWRQVPAQVEHAELVSSRGSKSTSYRVVARYRYTVEGREYEGSRVGLQEAFSSGDFHSERFELLDAARRDAVPFPVWVNPADPTESIAFPEPTWIQFALFGAGLAFFGFPLLVGLRVLKAVRARARQEVPSATRR